MLNHPLDSHFPQVEIVYYSCIKHSPSGVHLETCTSMYTSHYHTQYTKHTLIHTHTHTHTDMPRLSNCWRASECKTLHFSLLLLSILITIKGHIIKSCLYKNYYY